MNGKQAEARAAFESVFPVAFRHLSPCNLQRPPLSRTTAIRPPQRLTSGRKPEMHHVAIGDYVVLAFEPHLSCFLGAGLTIVRDVIAITDGLGADEALFEIGMNCASRLWRPGSLRDGPGARLLRTGGEIGDQVQKCVAGTYQAVEAGFRQPDRREIVRALVCRQRRI